MAVALRIWPKPAGRRPRAVPTRGIWISVFAVSAVMAALGGLLIVGFSGTADSTLGDPYLFEGIAAVILGGAAPLIGAVSYWRTVLGALIYTVLSTLLIGHGLSYAAQQVALGILILLALGLYGREARIRDRV